MVCPIGAPPGTCGGTIDCSSPSPRSKTGWRRRGKKAREHVVGEYLETVQRDFSGYIAADELYDGPFCLLSIVDNHSFHRLIYEVLDHDPTHEDITQFFKRFHAILEARQLALKGITTDGSALYPGPIGGVFGDVPHQVCEFHVIAELTRAILKAVAKVRKDLKAALPKLGRGRPSAAQKKTARKRQRMQRKIADLFDNRHLFVKHHLTRGQPGEGACLSG